MLLPDGECTPCIYDPPLSLIFACPHLHFFSPPEQIQPSIVHHSPFVIHHPSSGTLHDLLPLSNTLSSLSLDRTPISGSISSLDSFRALDTLDLKGTKVTSQEVKIDSFNGRKFRNIDFTGSNLRGVVGLPKSDG